MAFDLTTDFKAFFKHHNDGLEFPGRPSTDVYTGLATSGANVCTKPKGGETVCTLRNTVTGEEGRFGTTGFGAKTDV